MSYRLRLVRESDLDNVMRWRMLPEVTQYMYTDPVLTLEQQRAWYQRIAVSQRDLVWIIETVGQDGSAQGIGVLSLSEIDRVHQRCAWAYYIGERSARGIGLAKALELSICAYVFDTLSLNKLWCEVFASNDRVVALHQRFGSTIEGVARAHIFKNDQWHDVVRMGLLKSEWAALRDKWNWTTVEIESRLSLA